MSTCNRLDLQTLLGSQPMIIPNKSPRPITDPASVDYPHDSSATLINLIIGRWQTLHALKSPSLV
jgi:hypothetical protein